MVVEYQDPEKAVQTELPPLSRESSSHDGSTLAPVDSALNAEANIPDQGPTSKSDEVSPPPNGGFNAWLQVAGSFFLFFNSWYVVQNPPMMRCGVKHHTKTENKVLTSLGGLNRGTVNTFGVFQTYYENNPNWTESPSNISWIGSIQAFLLLLVGVMAGPAYDAGYFRALITTGAFLIPFGFMMTSLCKTYWQTMLAQGIVVGLGNGCLFVPSVALLPQYFSTRKALANGIAASGSSVGGVVYPIAFRKLEQEIGFAWATRIVGFIALVTCSFSVLVMRPRVLPKEKRKLTDFAAFKEPPYLLFSLGMVLGFISFYGPIFYLQSFSISTGVTSASFGFYLLPILNAASVPGRIFPNFLTDYIGPLNVLTPACITTGVLALVWIGISNQAGIIAFSVFYGFFSGAFVSLPPVAIVTLTPDMRKLGTRMGQVFFVSAFGLLIGTPISGAILSSTGGYLGVQLFSGIILLCAGCLMIATRTCKVGPRLMVKA